MPRERKTVVSDVAIGDRVIPVAAAMFRRLGYARTSTRELATRLGIQSGSLYHYINGKDDLLYQICSSALTHIEEAVRKATAAAPVERKLEVVIKRHLISALTDSDSHATMLVELKALSAERKAAVIRQRDQYEELIRTIIEESQAAGVVRADIEAKYLTLGLLNLLNWSIFWFDPDGPLTEDELARVLAAVFLDGARGGGARASG
ncbi:TetR/AcrR family transcriptional regulator [Phytohabitans kaempferiae]|uniref:TetR/AcrR family transcriptional regulator n=1 Tax=Phytohabitans kaempferiae TaxID=1620943 RepID=A0ABV6LXG1_9ACTN